MKLSDIDLRLLRVFQAVAEAGGFARAQGALGISQPAISSQIAKLEDRLSLRLCERGPQGFALTSDGTLVLKEVNTLLDQIDAAAARLNAIGSPAKELVRIGVVDSMVTDPENPLIALLRELKRDRPRITVSIGIYDYLACLEELRANRLDIAIVGIAGNERIPTEAEAVPLYCEISSLYCSPDHPCAGTNDAQTFRALLASEKISAHSFVFNPIDKDLDPLLLGDHDGISQDSIELTAYHTLSSTHVGLLPDHYAAPWLADGTLVSLARYHDPIVSEFHAVRLQPAPKSTAAAYVWNALVAKASI